MSFNNDEKGIQLQHASLWHMQVLPNCNLANPDDEYAALSVKINITNKNISFKIFTEC